jgi:hypothetical protein
MVAQDESSDSCLEDHKGLDNYEYSSSKSENMEEKNNRRLGISWNHTLRQKSWRSTSPIAG